MARPEDPTARDRLLDAAGRLFYERGVPAVGVAEIVAEAGTGKQALYRHFPGGKDDVVLAYLTGFAERLTRRLDEAAADLPPDEALVAVARHVATLVSDRRFQGCPFRNYLRETRDTDGPAGRFALGQVRGFRLRLERLVAGLDDAPPGLTEELWLVLEGLYATALYPGRRRTAADTVALVERLVA